MELLKVGGICSFLGGHTADSEYLISSLRRKRMRWYTAYLRGTI